MSWAIERTENNSEALKDLAAAIDEAHQKNILMFCAGNDRGLSSYYNESYPANCGHVFCIGAATATGERSVWVRDSEVDFLFPGDNVMVEAMDISLPLGNLVSGSSLAAALAAGLAAQILYCVEIAAPESLTRVGSYEGMNRVLQGLCIGKSRFPLVSSLFNTEFGDLPWEGTSKLQDIVQKLLNL